VTSDATVWPMSPRSYCHSVQRVVLFLLSSTYISHLTYSPSLSFGIVSFTSAPSATLQRCSGHAPSCHTHIHQLLWQLDGQARVRNDLYCVEWDVQLYYSIPYHTVDRSVSVPMTLSDLERQVAIFPADLHRYAHNVSPRTTKFGMVTCGEWRVSSRSAMPPPKAEPHRPQKIGTSSIRPRHHVTWQTKPNFPWELN